MAAGDRKTDTGVERDTAEELRLARHSRDDDPEDLPGDGAVPGDPGEVAGYEQGLRNLHGAAEGESLPE